MAESNFQDVVVLHSNTLTVGVEALIIGTDVGSKSIILAQDPAQASALFLIASNPTAQISHIHPNANGTVGLITAISAGTTLQSNGQIVLSNSNLVSFGVNASTITASAGYVASVSAGTTNATGNQVVFSNANGISFGANGATITAKEPSFSLYRPSDNVEVGFPIVGNSTAGSNVTIRRISVPNQISATELDMLAHLTLAGSTAGSFTLSACMYTFAGSTASSVSSGSVGYTWNSGTNTGASSIYGGNSGTRWRTMSINTWNITPGEYLMAIAGSINGPAGTTGTLSLYGISTVSVVAAWGGGNFSQYWADGIFSGGTAAFPASIHLSALLQTGSTALALPHFRLIGSGP
jgi:hypothetical protein